MSIDHRPALDAFLAEIEAERRRMRRRDLFLRLVLVVAVVWIAVPAEGWKPPRLGGTLAYGAAVLISQLLVFLGWFQRVAERWVRNAALQIGIVAVQILLIMLGCEAAYKALARL